MSEQDFNTLIPFRRQILPFLVSIFLRRHLFRLILALSVTDDSLFLAKNEHLPEKGDSKDESK